MAITSLPKQDPVPAITKSGIMSCTACNQVTFGIRWSFFSGGQALQYDTTENQVKVSSTGRKRLKVICAVQILNLSFFIYRFLTCILMSGKGLVVNFETTFAFLVLIMCATMVLLMCHVSFWHQSDFANFVSITLKYSVWLKGK